RGMPRGAQRARAPASAMGAGSGGLAACSAQRLPDGCDARPCLGPESPGSDEQVLMNSALLKASSEGNVAGIQRALAGGADLETRRPMVIRPRCMKVPDETGDDPVDLPKVLGLGDHGAKAKGKVRVSASAGLTPLMRSAKEGHAKAVALLLQKRANVDAKDEDGMTPLHFAACGGCRDSCEALLQAGADARLRDDDSHDAFDRLPPECVRGRKEREAWLRLLRPEAK
ncbi:unnamed protein product, partial [Prorocentrum cordatum]